MPEVCFAKPQVFHVGGSDAGVDVAGDTEALGSDEEADVFSHEGAVGAFDPIKPLAFGFFSDSFQNGSVDDEEGAAGCSALDEGVGRVVGSAGESVVAVVVLLPVEDGGSRDATVSTHAVFGGFTLCEAQSSDDGSMVGVGE